MVTINIASPEHLKYAGEIVLLMEKAAKKRGTGIAKRKVEYIQKKIQESKAVIATDGDCFVGFCYIETWEHKNFVANSGLIVKESYRGKGIAKKLKYKAFELSRKKYPEAKLFGITTSLAVMKINTELGYKPVALAEITRDESFWEGCKSCVNYPILMHTGKTHCLCTGMLFDPATANSPLGEKNNVEQEKISQE